MIQANSLNVSWNIFFKFLIILFSFGSFFILAFITYKKYREAIVILTPQLIHHPEGLSIPAVTFCNHSGFKNQNDLNTNITQYLENTIEHGDIFLRYSSHYSMALNSGPEQERPDLKSVWGKFHGRCYTYNNSEKVRLCLNENSLLNFLVPKRLNQGFYSAWNGLFPFGASINCEMFDRG